MTSVNNFHCEETCLQLVAICNGAAVNLPCSCCDLVPEQHCLQLHSEVVTMLGWVNSLASSLKHRVFLSSRHKLSTHEDLLWP